MNKNALLMTGMEGSGTVSLDDAERELILSRLNGGDDERVFVNWADVIDFLRVEIKKMRSGTTLSLLGTFLDTIEFGGNAITF